MCMTHQYLVCYIYFKLFYRALLKLKLLTFFIPPSRILFASYIVRNILFLSETHSPAIPHRYKYTDVHTHFQR